MSKRSLRPGIVLSQSILTAPEVRDYVGNEKYSHNHLRVIFRWSGSVWPKVLPICLLNTILAAVLWHFVRICGLNFVFSQDANNYLASLLAFLVVTRVRMIYDRNMYTRGQLENLCDSCENLVKNAISLTSHNTSIRAQKWRDNIAYLTIMLLKHTMDAFREHSDMLTTKMTDELEKKDSENFRKPIMTAYKLRKVLVTHGLKDALKGPPFMKALGSIDQFTTAYHELGGISRLSFPFPLVQMARTILFIWLACLPLALCKEDYPLWGMCLMVFLLTFGFTGLEAISIEMNDPFGCDITDFDLFFMGQLTIEDIYIMIYNVHGLNAAEELVQKVRNPIREALI